MTTEVGRDPTGQALVNGAASVSALAGFDPSRWADLVDALAQEKRATEECPVRQGKVGDQLCPKCRASTSQGCGPADSAGYAVLQAAKALAKSATEAKQVQS